MKYAFCILVACLSAAAAVAQQDPVMSSVRQIVQRQEKNVVGAAEEMPADKYSYKPTAQQMTFGKLVTHLVESNNFLCSRLSGAEAPKGEVQATAPKDELVSALKASFDFCNAQLAKVNDSALGATVKLWGGREMSKAAAAISLTDDLADHYSQAAMYLRLNDLLPPSAKAREK